MKSPPFVLWPLMLFVFPAVFLGLIEQAPVTPPSEPAKVARVAAKVQAEKNQQTPPALLPPAQPSPPRITEMKRGLP